MTKSEWNWLIVISADGVYIFGTVHKDNFYIATTPHLSLHTARRIRKAIDEIRESDEHDDIRHITKTWAIVKKGNRVYVVPSEYKVMKGYDIPVPRLSATRFMELYNKMEKKVRSGEVKQTKEMLNRLNRLFNGGD